MIATDVQLSIDGRSVHLLPSRRLVNERGLWCSERVKIAIVHNPKTLRAVLERLATDPDEFAASRARERLALRR